MMNESKLLSHRHLSLQDKLANRLLAVGSTCFKAIGWLLMLILIVTVGVGLGTWALTSWGAMVADLLTQTDKNFWYLSRASGIVAYALFWLAMVFGLLLGTRLSAQLGRFLPAGRLFALHQFISLLAIGFAGFHALILLGDSYLNLSVWQIILPFGLPTDRVGVALGQVGFWLLFVCGMSYYIKSYIGQTIWRWLHFLTFMAYMLVSVHLFVVGSDNQALPLLLFYGLSQTLVFVLIGYRLWRLNVRELA